MNSEDGRITSQVIEDVCARLRENKRIQQPLPGGGMLQMDRLLPFLCVYRRNPTRRDEGTSKLVMSEASYLCAPGNAVQRSGLRELIREIAKTAIDRLGSFLIMEIWSGEDRVETDEVTGELCLPRAMFQILARRPYRPQGTVATLEFALQRVRVHRRAAKVEIKMVAENHPNGMKELMSEAVETQIGCHVMGLEVRPVYRDPETGELYDRISRSFGRQVSHALKKSFFVFALTRTEMRPEHYHALGTSRLSMQILTIDRKLAELSREFKFLLLVTPINAERSWNSFVESGYHKPPSFEYRPLDQDPLLLKRRLMNIHAERVDNPTLAHVFRQTQLELDRQITMLADIDTDRFLPGSLQVFDRVAPKLRDLARDILSNLADLEPVGEVEMMDANQFAEFADKEIQYYRDQSPLFAANVTIRDDIFSGLLVAGGDLLIGRQTRIAKSRAEALLQHEVGTHLVTYFNGSAQPLRLLQVGLAGYDALQEGLAVFAEYLVGGLSAGRMRTLAARVIAADQLVQGLSFLEVFSQLVEAFGFEPRTAYTITLRVFRGGGLTKDALYLQGLVKILDYLGSGGDLEPLMVGKMAVQHVPIIRELLLCGVLRTPPLRPKYLDTPAARDRLAKINPDTTVLDLISKTRREL
ncbi:flavohemoglobin expression-modulating QEGLA motif protein [Novipirellula artificiosorum]|uniref:Flavohemoglobin expression-modulating QEGLA motif protein n=1 Tax=Novipirellula artificiosorum TaxID=2528016 RepID=A0A5C6D806_9BACT|nr:flavohemoglobin expression-modulating QEGLA motif protein [Novipirellula artificiosorum]TWU31366.1 hypothetical protein Poly41_62350 [Novipirellula artificiosorum]